MKKIAAAFAVAILVSGFVALNLWRDLHTERQQHAALQARVTQLEAAQVVAAPVTPAAPDIAAPPAATNPTQAPVVPAAAAGAAAEATRTALSGAAAMMASPAGQELMRTQVRAELERQYPDLAKALSLTPAETAKFFDLLARQAGGMMGDAFSLLGGGNDAGNQMMKKMLEQQEAGEAEIRTMLGSRYPKWQEYQGTVAARQQVTQLRAMLGSGDNALDEARAQPLITALGVETARINEELSDRTKAAARNSQNVLEVQLQYTAEQNERLLRVATPHLTGPQLDSYKRMLDQQTKMMRMLIAPSNGQGNARGQAGAPR